MELFLLLLCVIVVMTLYMAKWFWLEALLWFFNAVDALAETMKLNPNNTVIRKPYLNPNDLPFSGPI